MLYSDEEVCLNCENVVLCSECGHIKYCSVDAQINAINGTCESKSKIIMKDN